MTEEINQKPNIIHTLSSTQSFEILEETPKTINKDFSYDVLPNKDNLDDDDNEPQTLDEEIVNNSPVKDILQSDSFSLKKEQIKQMIRLFKESGQNTKTRREIRSLERHLEKLEESEKNNMDYEKFKATMIENIKNDKNMNQSIKKLYKKE